MQCFYLHTLDLERCIWSIYFYECLVIIIITLNVLITLRILVFCPNKINLIFQVDPIKSHFLMDLIKYISRVCVCVCVYIGYAMRSNVWFWSSAMRSFFVMSSKTPDLIRFSLNIDYMSETNTFALETSQISKNTIYKILVCGLVWVR